MKVSFESPLCLLEESIVYNDYEYCLGHLLDEYEEYNDFYKRNRGRYVILDNSVFELERAVSKEKFIEYIERIQPSAYIIPDFLDDATTTTLSVTTWDYNSHHEKIGVVQGRTYKEALNCFLEIQDYVDIIAISFNSKFFSELVPHIDNQLLQWAYGRQMFISLLKRNDYIRKPIHLLGCALPFEMPFYGGMNEVVSIDTSFPITSTYKLGVVSVSNRTKPTEKMYTMMEEDSSKFDRSLLFHNTRIFKMLTRGVIV